MRVDLQVTHGIFCYEIKNRFRAIVDVNGDEAICYVASSCRLSNFLDLEKRDVLLVPARRNANRTDYTLFAVKYRDSYILLELSQANAAVAEQIHKRYFCFLGSRKEVYREKTIAGYKADVFIEDTNTIIEIKTVISENKEAVFPTLYSERSLGQLDKIETLLVQGYRICYLLTSLCSAVKRIVIDTDTDYGKRLKKCMELGLMLKAYRLKTTENEICINGVIPIDLR